MAEESLTIQVDLDAQKVLDSLGNLEKQSEKSGKKAGDSFEKGLSKSFNVKLKKNIESTNSNLANTTKRLIKVASAVGTVTSALLFLEKNFGAVSKSLAKIGISTGVEKLNSDLINTGTALNKVAKTISVIGTVAVLAQKNFGAFDGLIEKLGFEVEEVEEKFRDLIDIFGKFVLGEKGLLSLKIASGQLLQELGIIDSKAIAFINTLQGIGNNAGAIAKVTSGATAAGLVFVPLIKNGRSLVQLLGGVSSVLLKGKGLFGTVSALGGIAAAFKGISLALDDVDNVLAKVVKNGSLFIAFLTGSLAAALGFAIVKVAEFAQELGTKLVGEFRKTTSFFIDADSNLQVFLKTVENFDKVTGGAVGSIESWREEIASLSNQFNISNKDLLKAGQEIVQVGSQIGLQEDQLKSLIRVTAEYAKINKKDVFDTSVAVVSALNGQSQAAQALGIKLNEASVQQFAYKKGLTENIRSLASGEVVQLRYNKLLDQYSNISGIAAVQANSLAGQQEKLIKNQERLSEAIGRGASIIENNNLLAAAYNQILDNVNSTVISVAGFLGALGSRLLQVGGFVLGFSFKVFALVKALKILNLVLGNQTSIKIFEATIPRLNKSINDVLTTFAGAEVRVKSLRALLVGLGQGLKNSANSFLLFTTGSGLKGLTFFGALRGAIAKLIPVLLTASKAFIAFLIPLAPLIIKATLIAGAAFLIFKAFQKLEERTGALSVIWDVLVEALTAGASIFQPLINLVTRFTTQIKTLVNQGLGLAIVALAKIIDLSISLAQTDIGKRFFNQEQLDRLTVASGKLNRLSGDLQKVAFDFSKLGNESENAGRKIAGSLSKVRPEDFANLTNQLKDVGKTQLQILGETRDARLKLLDGALKQGLTTEANAFELRNKILLDFNSQRDEILKAQREKEAQARQQALETIIGLQNELAEFGLTDLERITLQQEERLALVNSALEQEIISYQRAEQIKTNIVAQANKQRFDVINSSLTQLNEAVKKQVQGALVKTFSAAFQEIGRTLAGAGQGFKAFLGVVLNIFADLAIQIGTTIIAASKAIQALISNPFTAGGAGIVLGAALIAVGAALKVFAGGLGGSSAGFSSAGGSVGGASSSGGGGFDSTTFTTPEAEREEPQPVFQLTVQGDIFDTQDTSRRVLDLFTQAAEDEGVTFENGAFA